MNLPVCTRIANHLYMGSIPTLLPHPPRLWIQCAGDVRVYEPQLLEEMRRHDPRATLISPGLYDEDRKLTEEERRAVDFAARAAHRTSKAGFDVLITCVEGRNRSGLVMAETLKLYGKSPLMIVAGIRRARSSACLTNQHFVQHILRS